MDADRASVGFQRALAFDPLVLRIGGVMDRSQLINRLSQWGALAGSLAHELKNPLSTINLTLHLLKEDLVTPDRTKIPPLSRVEMLISEVEHLQRILNDFLRLAREPKLTLEPVDFNSLVEDAVAFLAPEFERRGVRAVVSLDRGVKSVLGDQTLLRQGLLNLLRNALDAMLQGGSLTLQTRRENGALRVTIIDTGRGMDAAIKERIFDGFFSTKPGGTGIGLPLTRQIVERHGGRIEVESEAGRGSMFTVWLPIDGPADKGAPQP